MKLNENLATAFPAITNDLWAFWGAWYVHILVWSGFLNDAMLVVLDADGAVHVRRWNSRADPNIFMNALPPDSYVFVASAVRGVIKHIQNQPRTRLQFQPDVVRRWRTTATMSFLTIYPEDHPPIVWSWEVIGLLYKFVNERQSAVRSGGVVEILIDGGNDLAWMYSRVRGELAELGELMIRRVESAENQLNQSRALHAQMKVVEEYRRLLQELSAAQGATALDALKVRRIVLDQFEKVLAVEGEHPGYFETAKAGCAEQIVICDALIKRRTREKRLR